jgi:RHS repeat-associated protein
VVKFYGTQNSLYFESVNNWDEATSFSDSLGRTIRTQAKDSQGDVFTETKYDNLGRVEKTSNPYREGDVKYWSKPRYDELNRVVETYAPEIEGLTGASLGITEFGISTVQDFVGTYTTATDASGRRARSITNALGQLVRIDEPTGINNDLGLIGSPNQPTFYKYNPQGKMVKVSQGQQNRFFLYDYLGRLIRVKQPEQEVNTALDLADTVTNNNQWTAGFEYDIVGNLKKTTDAKGSVITNSYDKAGRVTLRSYSNEPQGVTTPNVEYFYDGKGLTTPQTPNYAKGKLTKVTSSISETRYNSFDNFGRLLQMEQRTPFDTETIANATPRVSSYQYDFGGALVQETYPSGRVVKNDLNAFGDLSRITSKSNANAAERVYASGFSYTADGQIQRLRLGSGRWESAKFDNRLQMTEMTLGTSNGDGSLWKLKYEYGELNADGSVNQNQSTGNIAKQTISYQGLAQPFVQTFKYDALSRIVEAKENNGSYNGTQNWKQTFDYDRFGNRTNFTQVVGTQQLAINNQTLPSIDATSNRFNLNQGYVFDKNGNITEDNVNGQIRKFTFNAENKQTEIKDANEALIGNYFYDGEGNRVKKVTQAETTIFVYSSGKLIAEYSTATPPINKQIRYFGTDQLLTPRVITNQNGEVISRRDYMPFGEEININRPTNVKYGVLDDGVRQGFTNYERDKETNLDFAEARYYNNRHGRFTAVDPLLSSGKSSNPQTFNRYVYVMNRPIILTDPSGMQTGNHSGTVYTNGGNRFSWRNEGEGWHEFTGNVTYTANDGFIYNVYEGGWNYLPSSTPNDSQPTVSESWRFVRFGEPYPSRIYSGFGPPKSNDTDVGFMMGVRNWGRNIGNLGILLIESNGGNNIGATNRFISNPAFKTEQPANEQQARAAFAGSIACDLLSGAALGGASRTAMLPSKLNPSAINFMQSSIKNTTGKFTVLGNAESLKAGTLSPEVLRMNVWKDAGGKIWTLDHRRLAAFKLSGLSEAPVNWAPRSLVESSMWKMTTNTGGSSIKLKLGGGVCKIVQ